MATDSAPIERYFSIGRREAFTPNDLPSLTELEEHIAAFGERYSSPGKLFAWTFRRARNWSGAYATRSSTLTRCHSP